MEEEVPVQQSHSAQFVGNAFVQQYYQILHFTPSLVHKFYQDTSNLGRPNEDGSMSITTTMDAINEKILSLNYDQLVPTIKSVDAQDSLNGGIHVLVTGKLSGSDNVIRSFTQTFFLAPQQQGFYVLNDIFRYVEDVSHEVNDEVLVENVDSPDILEKETPTILENGVSEESYVIVGEADIEDAKNPSENEEVPVIEKEMVTVAEVVEEKIPTVVEVVKKVEQQKREIIAESDTKTEETPKKSYASLVMGWKENGAPLSAPTPAVRKSPQKVQAQQVHSNPPAPAAVEATIPNTDVAENEINHEGEAEGYSIYIKGLPLNTTIPQIDEEFNKFGLIKTNGIQVKSNRQSGICFGFVRYEAESAMQKAIEASPITIGGRQAVIEEKRSTSSRGGYNRGGRFLGGRGVPGEFRNNGTRGGRGSYGGGRGGSYGVRSEFNRGNTSSRGGMGYQRSDSMGSNNGGRYVNRPVTGGSSGGGGFNENTKNMPPRVPATA
jgi:hypothetical protein